jgi:hypothetical protein
LVVLLTPTLYPAAIPFEVGIHPLDRIRFHGISPIPSPKYGLENWGVAFEGNTQVEETDVNALSSQIREIGEH